MKFLGCVSLGKAALRLPHHGIGQLKRDEMRHYKSAVELEMMRTIKRAFDPQGLMNPGKVL